MNVLGIETSCDETAAAVVRDGIEVLSNIIYTQIALHRPYGGVVPEIASRNHLEKLPPVITEALTVTRLGWQDIDMIAVTYGPGLAGSLLVGLAAAKSLALRLDRPLVPVDHMEAHLYSAFLSHAIRRPEDYCPLLVLIVSGGHTSLVRMAAPGRYAMLGQTIDDAAGEAFDKGAALLQLGYPGGPAIDRAAVDGNPKAVSFPRGLMRRRHAVTADGLPTGEFDFSFSGLKTALLYHLKALPPEARSPARIADIAASYQEAIVDTLVTRTAEALRDDERGLAVVGGVSLNRRLRAKIAEMAKARGVPLLLATPAHCTDNAAMVAGLAGSTFPQADRGDPMALDADPTLEITERPMVGSSGCAAPATPDK